VDYNKLFVDRTLIELVDDLVCMQHYGQDDIAYHIEKEIERREGEQNVQR